MPIHDWTRVDAGLFHDFHQSWAVALRSSLNAGRLPADYFALMQPPKTRLTQRTEMISYVRKASFVSVRHRHGDVVTVIEIVSPGNKASRGEFRTLVQKSAEQIRQGIHLLVIDLFPPGKRDPKGIHKAIWDEFQDEDFEVPSSQPLTLASYDAGPECVAYVEFVGVGDSLPEMPLFLRPGCHVPVPLDETYQVAWISFPDQLKGLLNDAPSTPS